MLVQVGLCQTCSETTLLVFPRGGSFYSRVVKRQMRLLGNLCKKQSQYFPAIAMLFFQKHISYCIRLKVDQWPTYEKHSGLTRKDNGCPPDHLMFYLYVFCRSISIRVSMTRILVTGQCLRIFILYIFLKKRTGGRPLFEYISIFNSCMHAVSEG